MLWLLLIPVGIALWVFVLVGLAVRRAKRLRFREPEQSKSNTDE